MNTIKTLIYAVIPDEKGSSTPENVHLFASTRKGSLAGKDIKTILVNAFFEWAKTKEGYDYVSCNGANWGDAMEIPKGILRKFGILNFQLLDMEVFDSTGPFKSDKNWVYKRKKKGTIIRGFYPYPENLFEEKMIVDHDEELIDLESIDLLWWKT